MNTPRGKLRVSAEATALELVGYVDQCGGIDNVASVLSELAPNLEKKKLTAAARLGPIAWTQRLGYLRRDVKEAGLTLVYRFSAWLDAASDAAEAAEQELRNGPACTRARATFNSRRTPASNASSGTTASATARSSSASCRRSSAPTRSSAEQVRLAGSPK